jgi:large subunit ribosomal protein L5
MSQLKERYKKEISPALMERQGYKNIMQVPRLEKIVLNIGLGEAITNAKALEAGEADLAAIAGHIRYHTL